MDSSKLWRWFFILAALEAGAAFVALIRLPSEGGVSASRLVLLGIPAIFLCVSGYLAGWPPKRIAVLQDSRSTLAGVALALLCAIALFLLRYLAPERLLPYYQRLAPVLWYWIVLGVQLSVFSAVARRGLELAALREAAPWRVALLIFFFLLCIFAFVAISRVGLTPDSAYWGEPAPPIVGWQFALAVLAGAALFVAGTSTRFLHREFWLPLGIWLLAVVIWLSVPTGVMKNSFYGPIDPPAFQSFPNSDAGYYDSMAHSVLIGYPYLGDIPTRPLYITFLALLHLLVGERYDLMDAGQTLVLALIPVVLYILGRWLHSPPAGLVAALFAIFREWNSLLISSQTRVSNSRTLLVDLPTLLLLLAVCLFLIRWIQNRRDTDALLFGGLLGLLLLLRTQTLLLLPLVLLIGLVASGFRIRAWLAPLAFFMLGLVAASAPWLLHNYLYTGHLTLDAPFEYKIIVSQYRYTGNLDLSSVDLEGKSLAGLLLAFLVKDPRFVFGFIGSHFFETLIDGVLALPLAAPYAGLFAPINLYWMNWPAGIDALNAALLVPYLAGIALGIAAAWRRLRWAGLVPLIFGVGYALTNGVARFSGWRYDLPADWIAYFYLAIGLCQLLGAFGALFGRPSTLAPPSAEAGPGGRAHTAGWIALLGALAVVGALPWFAERLSAPRYERATLEVLTKTLSVAPAVQRLELGMPQIETFLGQPQATLFEAQLLYPRYFTRGNGLASAHPWPAYAAQDYARMGFILINQSRHDARMPLHRPESDFEQGSDAIVLGCLKSDYMDVRLIFFPQTGSAYLSAPLDTPCD